jgi:hypothetical protein
VLRAIDRKTGVLVWSARVRENPKGRPGVKTKPGHLSIFSPVVIKVGDGTRSVPDTSTGADGTRRVV